MRMVVASVLLLSLGVVLWLFIGSFFIKGNINGSKRVSEVDSIHSDL